MNSSEKGSFMKKKAAVLLTAAVLTGCAGPSTKVLPQRQSGTMQEVPDEVPVVEEVNSFYLQESLGILSASPRPSGSRGEDNAARYIQKLLKDCGYTVNRQRFREKSEHEEVSARLSLERTWFPTRIYNDLVIPCGTYDAARVILGKGKGHNWWCVLYPRFCFLDEVCKEIPEKSRRELQDKLNQGDYPLLEDHRPDIKIRFFFFPELQPVLPSHSSG